MDVSKLAAGLAATLKEYVAAQVFTVSEHLSELSKRLDALPVAKDGVDGKDGKDGLDGASVSIDATKQLIAEQIATMPPAKDGIDGRKGADGTNGTDGRDALDLDVMRGIDAEKRYRKGCYATHNGGLWLSRKSTDGMDGWECIVDGVYELTAELDEDGRSIQVRSIMASGAVVEKGFSIPTMVYRDLFKEGQIYQRGDTVTWAGHMWICKKETDEKPQEGEAWRIAVKRGADAPRRVPA